ncbi:MAG TPA: hypothetical protein VH277_02895 [Gemmatimonadaceae bacterium]|jgi:hypothetical protein|nr:hypothetical protein [Gemmatimonadaceae bacterium]
MHRSCIQAAALLMGVSIAAHAQAVRIHVTDDIDEAPIPSALVTLLSDHDLHVFASSGHRPATRISFRHGG